MHIHTCYTDPRGARTIVMIGWTITIQGGSCHKWVNRSNHYLPHIPWPIEHPGHSPSPHRCPSEEVVRRQMPMWVASDLGKTGNMWAPHLAAWLMKIYTTKVMLLWKPICDSKPWSFPQFPQLFHSMTQQMVSIQRFSTHFYSWSGATILGG